MHWLEFRITNTINSVFFFIFEWSVGAPFIFLLFLQIGSNMFFFPFCNTPLPPYLSTHARIQPKMKCIIAIAINLTFLFHFIKNYLRFSLFRSSRFTFFFLFKGEIVPNCKEECKCSLFA